MGFRKATAAWAAVLLTTAGVGTGIAVMADDPKPKAGTAPVAAAPIQPDKPPPTPKPAAKDQAEQERRKELAGTIDQFLKEREKLNAKADELQQLIAREQRKEMNPHVIQAMEALLTEVELTLFRTEMELKTEKSRRIAQAQREYNEARAKKVDPAVVDAQVDWDPTVLQYQRELKLSELSLQGVLTTRTVDHPDAQKLKIQIADLTDKLAKARLDARAKAAEEQIEAAVRTAKAKLDDAKRSGEGMEAVWMAAHKKRAEIIEALDKANERKQPAYIRRLTDELQANREMARRLSLLAMELELKLNGLPVPDAPGTSAADDKLDRVLRELADLRAEVRRLRERK